jgi:hypothetical protein
MDRRRSLLTSPALTATGAAGAQQAGRLLVGRPVLMPDATARTHAVQGRASYGRLLDGIIRVAGLVPPG